MKRIIDNESYILVLPDDIDDAVEHVPLVCPVCHLVMASYDDIMSYTKLTCCAWCERMWAQGDKRRERWLSGWRPDPAHVLEIKRSMGLC